MNKTVIKIRTESVTEIAKPASNIKVGIGTSIKRMIVIIPNANITSARIKDAGLNPPDAPPDEGVFLFCVVGKVLAMKIESREQINAQIRTKSAIDLYYICLVYLANVKPHYCII